MTRKIKLPRLPKLRKALINQLSGLYQIKKPTRRMLAACKLTKVIIQARIQISRGTFLKFQYDPEDGEWYYDSIDVQDEY